MRDRIAGADVDEVQLGIVGEAVPRIGPAAKLPPQAFIGPGGAHHGIDAIARLTVGAVLRIGGEEELPQLLAGIGIEGGGEPAHPHVAARLADHHLAIEHPRRAGDRIGVGGAFGEGAVGPDRLAASPVERDQPPVERGDDDLALVHGETPADRLAAGIAAIFARHLGIVGPQPFTRACIVRHRDVPRQCVVKHPVGIERRRLNPAIGVEIVEPGKAKLAHVPGIDLRERRIALRRIVAPVAGPLARIGHRSGGLRRNRGRGAGGEQQGCRDGGNAQGSILREA